MCSLSVHNRGAEVTAVHTDDLERLERLGGSRATVHRAVVRTTGRVVVVKHAPWDRPDVAAALGRESTVLSRCQHPALVRLLHTIDGDHGRTLVLAHAPGGSLARRLERHGPLPPTEVADLGSRLAEALAALHRQGVVHRDVHPGNVVVDAELQPLLVDLDHALDAAAEHLPTDDVVVGHPDHVDPRLFAGHPPGPACDLHALATTLWTLATGTPPDRPSPRDPVVLRPHDNVPPPLHDALVACLQAHDAATVATTLDLVDAEPAHGDLAGAALPDATSMEAAPAAAPTGPVARPAPAHTATTPVAHGDGGTPTQLPPPDPGPGHGGATRRWGAAPRPAGLAAIAPARGRRWVAAAAAAVVLLLAPVALWAVRSGPGEQPAVVVPPAPCAGVDATTAQVLADLDGDGCSEAMELADGVLTTATGSYRLGREGDVLVAGDWDGDGTWTPGLYRPATGEAFLFDNAPGGAVVTSRPVLRLDPGASPRVVDADGDGRHELVTAGA